jgi:hypothetical protein
VNDLILLSDRTGIVPRAEAEHGRDWHAGVALLVAGEPISGVLEQPPPGGRMSESRDNKQSEYCPQISDARALMADCELGPNCNICGVLRALVAALEKQDRALDSAWQDIHDWLRLAKRQRAELPQASHNPLAPTDAGIAKSERVLRQISKASLLGRHPEDA